jgi:preprotein translocase subunit SecD
MAIYLDGHVLSRPRILAAISDEGMIVALPDSEAQMVIAALIGSGPLPAPVKLVAVIDTVSV